jgi:predicted Zn-dependent peptidase
MKKPQIWDPYVDFQKTVLDNGLAIYSAYWNRPWIHAKFCVHSGSLQDPVGKEGLAHFVEHMVSERSCELSLRKIKQYIKRTGGSASLGGTNPHKTTFYVEVPLRSNHPVTAINLFSKLLLLPLEHKTFKRERNVILHEFREIFPVRKGYDITLDTYVNAYYGTRFNAFKETIGSPKSIQAITMLDLENFFMKHYNPANISIVAAGGIEHEELVAIVKKSLFSIESHGLRNPLPELLAEIKYPKNNEKIYNFSEIYPGVTLDVSYFDAYALIPGTFSRKALVVVRNVLKDILFEQLREMAGSTYKPEVTWEFLGDSYMLHVCLLLEKEKLLELKDLIILKSLSLSLSEKKFTEQRKYSVRGYDIDDLNIESLCKNASDNLVSYGNVLSSNEELNLFRNLKYSEYCSVVEYLLDGKRWWSSIKIQ